MNIFNSLEKDNKEKTYPFDFIWINTMYNKIIDYIWKNY